MSDMPNKAEILEEIGGFLGAASAAATKAWEISRAMNEQAAQRNELYRELSSRTSAALDYLKRAAKLAEEGFREVVETIEKSASKDDDVKDGD